MKSTRFISKAFSLALTSVLFAFAVTGCYHESTLTEDYLNGTWSALYESYTIDVENSTFDAGSYSYAGDQMEIDFTGNDSGYIYINYTRAYESTSTEPEDASSWTSYSYWMDSSYNCVYTDPSDDSYTKYTVWYRYSSTASDCGKWYAICFKDLTETSVSLSGAYGSVTDHYLTSTDTLAQAKKEFTVENGYFSTFSSLTKE